MICSAMLRWSMVVIIMMQGGASSEESPAALSDLPRQVAELQTVDMPLAEFRKRAMGISQRLAAFPDVDPASHAVWQGLVGVVLRREIPGATPLAYQAVSELLALPWPDHESTGLTEPWITMRLRDARLGVGFLSLCRAALIPAPSYDALVRGPTIPERLRMYGQTFSAIDRGILPSAELKTEYDHFAEMVRKRDQQIAQQQEITGTIMVFSGLLQKFLETKYAIEPVRYEELSEIMLMAGFDLERRRSVFTTVIKATGKTPADFLVTGMIFDAKGEF